MSERPGTCPPWCASYEMLGGGALSAMLHMSEGATATLYGPGRFAPPVGSLHAWAVQLEDGPAGVELYVTPYDGGGVRSGGLTVESAEAVARLVELLAGATPEAHRKAAAVIRQAAAVIAGEAARS